MQVTVSDAKPRLTDLVRRAEAGEDVVLTRHGHAVARLVGVKRQRSKEDRLKLITEVMAQAAKKVTVGPDAARSQDYLYDDKGLPK